MLIKPDALMRGISGQIISRIEDKGFTLSALKLLKMSKTMAEQLYSIHKGKPFYEPTVEFMTSSPIIALVISGPNVIALVRKLIGATNPLEADSGSIRGSFAVKMNRNCVHASDSLESAQREIPIFFGDEEICEYEKPASMWL